MKAALLSLLAAAALLVSACVSDNVPQTADPAAGQIDPAAALANYQLHSGDTLKIVVFGEEDLSGEFQVAANGSIALPLIGDTQAAGLTAAQLQTAIVTAYRDKGFLKAPQVGVEIQTYRPFFILGEVNKAGQYPYEPGMTVLNAVATAEGFTYRANQTRVFIKRSGAGGEQEVPLTSTTSVLPGDTVRIAERYF